MGSNCVGGAGRDSMKSTEKQISLGRTPLPWEAFFKFPSGLVPPNLAILQGSCLEQCYSKSGLGPEYSVLPGGLVAATQVYCIRICTLTRSQVMPIEV